MADLYGGLGGLFGGGVEGLRLYLLLRQAAEDQAIRREQLGLARRQDVREQEEFERLQRERPYQDIQKTLAETNVQAALPDIMAAREPPATVDTYAPTTPFAPPAFGAPSPAPGPRVPFAPEGVETTGAPLRPGYRETRARVPGIDTSHLSQVLARAMRHGGYQRGQDVQRSVLQEAMALAQTSQMPVSGTLPSGAQMEPGFTAMPSKVFTPYHYGMGPEERQRQLTAIWNSIYNETNRQFDDFAAKAIPLPSDEFLVVRQGQPSQRIPRTAARERFYRGVIDNYVAQRILTPDEAAAAPPLPSATDVIGGPAPAAGGGARGPLYSGKTIAQWIAEVKAAHPDWTADQVAAEAKRRAGVP